MAKQKQVLIIDDDNFYCQVYQSEFAKYDNISVSCVQDGQLGLQAIKQSPPDLILLDLVMPNRDGFWFLEQRRQDPTLAAIPLVINSGVASFAEIERVTKLGANAVFSKLALSPEKFSEQIYKFLSDKNPEWMKSKFVDITVVKEGVKLNDIFKLAAEDITAALVKFLGIEVTIGNLQATVAPVKALGDYLDGFMSGEKESTVVYSVLNPPIAAALFMVQNNSMQDLALILDKKVKDIGSIGDTTKEIYSVVANTFFNTVTHVFHSEKLFISRPPSLATPDLVLKILRKDGFEVEDSKVHFLFRQQYIIGKQIVYFNFILLLQEQGLRDLGGGI
jgi:two-component system, OmpR family, alkaline phosphatase synthesis response regulator PhoP